MDNTGPEPSELPFGFLIPVPGPLPARSSPLAALAELRPFLRSDPRSRQFAQPGAVGQPGTGWTGAFGTRLCWPSSRWPISNANE